MKHSILALGTLLLFVLGCEKGPSPQPNPSPAAPPPAAAATPTEIPPPGDASMQKQAPATFKVRFETTKGSFTIAVTREWAPRGADRFYNLAKAGFFNDVRFFRVVPGFVAQFGMHGTPSVCRQWSEAMIPDDPVKKSNMKSRVTFAMRGPNTRTTQFFINLQDNAALDRQGFSPFGEVTEGMRVVESFYSGYGDGPPQGPGPDQGRILSEGNAYLERQFPLLDYVKATQVIE